MKQRLHALGIGVMILALMSSAPGAMASKEHKVVKGDTLWSIAKRYNVPIDDIKRVNGVSANKVLKVGTKLTIPAKDDAEKTQEASAKKAEAETETDKQIVARFGHREAEKLDRDQNKRGNSEITWTALSYRGARYVRGGTGRNGFDCSGFTQHVYAKHGVKLPHQSAAQASCGKPVSREDLQEGDLLFFKTRGGRRISHVGLYIGDNKFIHASTPRRGVIVSSLNESYYSRTYCGARRVTPKK